MGENRRKKEEKYKGKEGKHRGYKGEIGMKIGENEVEGRGKTREMKFKKRAKEKDSRREKKGQL